MFSQRFVRTTPGDTALTRIGANSTAKARVSETRAPHPAAATVQVLWGRAPAIPVVNTIDPPCLIFGVAYFTAAKADQKRSSNACLAFLRSIAPSSFNCSVSPAV